MRIEVQPFWTALLSPGLRSRCLFSCECLSFKPVAARADEQQTRTGWEAGRGGFTEAMIINGVVLVTVLEMGLGPARKTDPGGCVRWLGVRAFRLTSDSGPAKCLRNLAGTAESAGKDEDD